MCRMHDFVVLIILTATLLCCDNDSETADADPSDADTEADQPCAELGQRCGLAQCCDEDGSVCALSPNTDASICRGRCTPQLCDYGEAPGVCVDYGTIVMCQPQGTNPGLVDCTPNTTDCETEYGLGEGTICGDSAVLGGTVCLAVCADHDTGCPDETSCVPLLVEGNEDEGACLPLGSDG